MEDPSLLTKEETSLILNDLELDDINQKLINHEQFETSDNGRKGFGIIKSIFKEDPNIPKSVPYVDKTSFYVHLLLTNLLYFIAWILLMGSIILASELYIAFPDGLNNFILSSFLKYRIIIILLGVVRVIIGLLLLFFGLFTRIHLIFSLLIWIAYVISNCLFGAFVSLILVNTSSDPFTSRIPNYAIIAVVTIFIIIILVVSLIISLVGTANKFAANIKRFAMNNTYIFRIFLFLLTIVVLINALPFKNFTKIPSWGVLILMAFIVAFFFLSIVNEVFDRNSYAINKRNAIEMSFYMLVVSSDFLFIITILLPSLGVRLFTNQILLTNVPTSSRNDPLQSQQQKNSKTKVNVKKFSSGIQQLLF